MAATWSQASDGCEALGQFATNKEDWCLSGDVAVMHPDGYVEIKDRSKDIIRPQPSHEFALRAPAARASP